MLTVLLYISGIIIGFGIMLILGSLSAIQRLSDERDDLKEELAEEKRCLQISMDNTNRGSDIIRQMSEALDPKPGETNIACAQRVGRELKRLESLHYNAAERS